MKKITIFKNIWDKQHPHFVPVDKVLTRIRDGASEDKIIAIRRSGDKEKRAEIKKSLPSVCFSGTFRTRNDKDIIDHSGLAILDFDAVGEPEYLKEELSGDPYIFAAWISPGGNGVKALVKIPAIVEDHRDHYRGLLARYNYAEADESNINESRVCYESFDPDIYINWNSQVFTDKVTIPEPERYEHDGTAPENAITDPKKIYSILKSWMDRTDKFEQGNRHNFYVKFAFNLCEFGVTQEDSVEWILKDYPHENPSNAQKAIEKGWSSKADKCGTKYFEDRGTETGEREYLTFWWVETEKIKDGKKAKIHFDRLKFIDWLQDCGFCRMKKGPNDWVFLHIQNQVAKEVCRQVIQEHTLSYVRGLPDKFDGTNKAALIDSLLRGSGTYFSAVLLDFIHDIPVDFLRDGEDESFFFYQNTAVRVGPGGYYTIPYSELRGVIWENQIIDRAFSRSDSLQNDFARFCLNVCGKDKARYDSLRSITGYLLSNYKDQKEFPAVVLMDEQISDHPEGGTGKGLYTQAIKYIKGGSGPSFPGVAMIDGKNWSLEKSFALQRVNLDTQILMIQDVIKKFDFEKFFSITAEGMEVEKKGLQSFYIPFESSPKIIITTNYTVPGQGNSNQRRLVEIEFAQHYTKSFTPFMDFGRLLFSSWSPEEWNAFDNYMMDCTRFFLSNKATAKDGSGNRTGQGIIKPVDINKSEKKLVATTHQDFIDWADDQITLGTKYDRARMFGNFLSIHQEFKWLTTRTFYSWLGSWANYRGYDRVEGKTGATRYYTFTEKMDEFDKTIQELAQL